jgi:predicted transcriptional regulator
LGLAIKEAYHPNAYLQNVRNVKSGLSARTKILSVLDKQSADSATVARNVAMSYAAVQHHLRLLEEEGTVRRVGKRPCSWLLTGLGQKRLVS